MDYQPDNSALSPEILVSGGQLLPNSDGSYRAPYPAVGPSYNTLTEASAVEPLNAFLGVKPNGTKRLFVGMGIGTGTTERIIYEADQGAATWTRQLNTTATGAGTYADWHFCQYESQTLAASKALAIQTSSSTTFAAVANAPKALVIDTLNDALWAWNVDDGTDRPDELFISDQGDITDWTVADDSLAYKTRLSECAGAGTAMIRYRDFMVIFKRRGMWLGQYTGDDKIYDVSLFTANVGCVGKDACLVVGDLLYFVDDQGLWTFDGANLRCVSDPYVSKTMMAALFNASTYAPTKIQLHYDDINKIVSVYGVAAATDFYRRVFWPYNTVSGKWGPPNDTVKTGNPDEIPHCVLNAPSADLVQFANLGVTATSNENRVNFYRTAVGISRVRNGHNGDTAGSAVTAWFGDPFRASTITQVWLNSDSPTGVTVSVSCRRGPRTSSALESSIGNTSFSTELLADLTVQGHFHKLTFGWNAQTSGTPGDFRKWQGFELETLRGGRH